MLKPGIRLRSQCCETEVIVIRGTGEAEIRCGGHALVDVTAATATGLSPDPGFLEGSVLGKRYTDAEGSLELLVTKGGKGSLSLGDTPLTVKSPKPLPSSD
ncbi:hypothetical protein ACFY1V_12605 [Streptomyces sp. NPDC001255]|uniref:hypothetical protein n=1 Tax=Streptomyces sp. NPDC001255 TaxID=3364550 RepID=UPI0036B8986D